MPSSPISSALAISFAVLLIPDGFLAATEPPDFQKNIPEVVVWAEEGGDAELPCNITAQQGDRINMILWFKDSTGIPLYSVDGRYGGLDQAHAALGSDLGRRSNFNRGPPARLRVSRVKPEDQGIFRCRVDFLNSPTRNYRVNLTLINPPAEPQILSGDGGSELRNVAGPYLVGHDIHLLCVVLGGEPKPKVTWWLEDKMLASGSEESADGTHMTRLHLGSVTGDFHGRKLSCKAKSTEASTHVSTTLVFQIYLKPSKVQIVTPNDLISAGRIKQLVCESYGSNPPANISWLLEGDPLRHQPVTESMEGNKTRSTLNLRPVWEDDGKELTCRAVNPKYPSEYVEDRRTLNIAYAAMAEVKMLSKPERSELREGDTVKLGCQVKSNPPPDSIMWYHGSELLKETGTELKLGPLSASSEGQYSCFVRNREGATRSRPISLRVRYAPFCKPGTEVKTVGAMMFAPVTVSCEVMADSEDDIKFSWTFNRSREVTAVSGTIVQSAGRTSHVTYTVQADKDFGTLACWAANSVGHQKKPCLVHIIHARLPTSPEGCTLQNKSREKLEVECTPGDDGGLTQQFILQVHAEGEAVPTFKLLSLEPRFRLRGLQPTKKYNLHIFAKNPVGISEPPVIIPGVLGPAATEKLTGKAGEESERDYWAVGGIAGLSGVVVLGIVLIALLRRRKRKKEDVPLNNLGPSIRIRYPEDQGSEFYTD